MYQGLYDLAFLGEGSIDHADATGSISPTDQLLSNVVSLVTTLRINPTRRSAAPPEASSRKRRSCSTILHLRHSVHFGFACILTRFVIFGSSFSLCLLSCSRTTSSLHILQFVFVIIVVLLNILIAIVSDSYDEAMARSRNLFWFARLKIVSGSNIMYGDLSWAFPNPNGPAILEENLLGDATKESAKLGRTQDIVERVRHNMANQMARAEDQHARTQDALMATLSRLEAKVDALEAAQDFSELPSREKAYSELSAAGADAKSDEGGGDMGRGVAKGTRSQRPTQVL